MILFPVQFSYLAWGLRNNFMYLYLKRLHAEVTVALRELAGQYHSRNDYKECLVLCLLFLQGNPDPPNTFKSVEVFLRPGGWPKSSTQLIKWFCVGQKF